MKLRTSRSLLPLAGVVALALVAQPVAAAPQKQAMRVTVGPLGHGLGDMSLAAPEPGRAATCPAAQEAIAGSGADKYSEAARHYEGCARSSGDAGLWKKAGMARYSARQYAHAIQALDRYLQTSPPGGDGQAEAMLEDARKNAATVRFSVVTAPGASAPERLQVLPRGGQAGDEIELPWARSAVSLDVWLDPGPWTAQLGLPGGGQVGPQDIQAVRDASGTQVVLFRVEARREMPRPARVELEAVAVELSLGPGAALRQGVAVTWRGPKEQPQQRVRAASSRWWLMPGEWQLQVEARRFLPVTRAVQVRPGEPHSLRVRLERSREEKLRVGVAAGLGGAAAALLVGGAVGAAGAGKDYRRALAGLDGTPSEGSVAAAGAAMRSIKASSNGVMVATSAAGVGIAAITVAAGGSDKLVAAEIGVGGALLIAGVAWLVPAKRRYAADAQDTPGWAPDRAYFDQHRRPELAAASLIGLGAGMAAGAAVALIARKLVLRRKPGARATLRPVTAPQAVGLTFQGNF